MGAAPTTTVLGVLAHARRLVAETRALHTLCFVTLPAYDKYECAAGPSAGPSIGGGRRADGAQGDAYDARDGVYGAQGGAYGAQGGAYGAQDDAYGACTSTLPRGFPVGMRLLAALHAQLGPLGAAPGLSRALLWRFFVAAAAPWLRWLRDTVFRAAAHDPHHEFTQPEGGGVAGVAGADGRSAASAASAGRPRLPSFLHALSSVVHEAHTSLRLLQHSTRYASEERGWPSASAPFFVLVASESELHDAHLYWQAHTARLAHQLVRIRASYALDERRARVHDARSLYLRRNALRQLDAAADAAADAARAGKSRRAATQRAMLEAQEAQQARTRSAAAAGAAAEAERVRAEEEAREALVARGREFLLRKYGQRIQRVGGGDGSLDGGDGSLDGGDGSLVTLGALNDGLAPLVTDVPMERARPSQLQSALVPLPPAAAPPPPPPPPPAEVRSRSVASTKPPPPPPPPNFLAAGWLSIPQLRRALASVGAALPPRGAYERPELEQLCRERGLLPPLPLGSQQLAGASSEPSGALATAAVVDYTAEAAGGPAGPVDVLRFVGGNAEANSEAKPEEHSEAMAGATAGTKAGANAEAAAHESARTQANDEDTEATAEATAEGPLVGRMEPAAAADDRVEDEAAAPAIRTGVASPMAVLSTPHAKPRPPPIVLPAMPPAPRLSAPLATAAVTYAVTQVPLHELLETAVAAHSMQTPIRGLGAEPPKPAVNGAAVSGTGWWADEWGSTTGTRKPGEARAANAPPTAHAASAHAPSQLRGPSAQPEPVTWPQRSVGMASSLDDADGNSLDDGDGNSFESALAVAAAAADATEAARTDGARPSASLDPATSRAPQRTPFLPCTPLARLLHASCTPLAHSHAAGSTLTRRRPRSDRCRHRRVPRQPASRHPRMARSRTSGWGFKLALHWREP